ncbi:MAG: type III pantothenate kinase [Ignavibacteriaceae bacterium]
MFLVCDIGNSKFKSGFFRDENISSFKIYGDTGSLLKFASGKRITAAAVSSVVPEKLKSFKKEFISRFDFNPVVIDKNSKFNLNIDYKTPGTLGIDRICSAEGAFFLFNLKNRSNKDTYIISVDFGTATTINVVKYNRIFTGGLILPGINMMFKSLKNETAQLPLVKPSEYKGTIGNSTKSSIASGVINATAGAINQTIDYLRQHSNKAAIKIYITGGNAKSMLPYLKYEYTYEPALVLYGIKAVYENTIKK